MARSLRGSSARKTSVDPQFSNERVSGATESNDDLAKPRDLESASDAAYVIYTSGSTGDPKGVVVDQQGLSEYVQWASEVYVQGKPKSFALYSPLTFDLTVTSVFVPLISGGQIVVYPESSGPADLSILDVVDQNVVDVVKLTPSHLALLSDKNLSHSRIQTLVVGGEDLKSHVARRIHQAFGGDVTIFNEYGPTEAVVGCMLHQYCPDQDQGTSVPIGKPAANRRIYLLDSTRNPVPEGGAWRNVYRRKGIGGWLFESTRRVCGSIRIGSICVR